MTGLRPSTTGVYNNRQPFRWARPDAVTLGQHLRANGYRVQGRGKMFHGRYPDAPSWDEYIPRSRDPAPKNRPVNGIENAGNFDWGPVDVSDDEMDDTKVVRWCGEQLQKKSDGPRFLACGLFRPHLPWYVPPKYFDLFPLDSITLPNVDIDDLDDVPAAGRRMARPERDHKRVTESDNWRRAVQGYLASIAFTDANIGRLLGAFEGSPDRDNTIVILWGDHGWHLGEKLHWRKFALWEEATRCPMMISAPGVTSSNSVSDRTVSLLDIYPTLSDLCGIPIREENEGKSLRPLLEDPATEWDIPAVTTFGQNNHSVRSERWRYIRYADGSEELYDHEADPLEWTNLANKGYDQVLSDHKRWLPKTNAPEGKRDRT